MAKEIVLIAAVGKRGQLGLNGGLPWGKDFPEDRERFRGLIREGVVVVGPKTYPEVRKLQTRCLISDNRDIPVLQTLEIFNRQFNSQRFEHLENLTWYIAGGAKTYARWLPHITRFDITVLDYDGPADVWMPPLFPPQPQLQFNEERAWLQAEIAQLENLLLKRSPEKDPVGHHQFTQRLADTRCKLETLKRIHDATAPLSIGQTDQSDAPAGSH